MLFREEGYSPLFLNASKVKLISGFKTPMQVTTSCGHDHNRLTPFSSVVVTKGHDQLIPFIVIDPLSERQSRTVQTIPTPRGKSAVPPVLSLLAFIILENQRGHSTRLRNSTVHLVAGLLADFRRQNRICFEPICSRDFGEQRSLSFTVKSVEAG